MDNIEIDGLDELQSKLGRLEGMEYMRAILRTGGAMLKDYIAKYPPATSANSPGQRRWYERGYGPKWTRADGSIGGTQSSETLGRRWAVTESKNQVIVGNNASYGPFVQSEAQQSSFHKARGWRTDDETIKEVGPKIQSMAMAEIARILESS